MMVAVAVEAKKVVVVMAIAMVMIVVVANPDSSVGLFCCCNTRSWIWCDRSYPAQEPLAFAYGHEGRH